MNKILCVISGIIFLALGIIGFVPGIVTGGYLFGAFFVDEAHCVIYVVSGIIGLLAAASNEYMAKMFLRVFGVLYAVAGILGFAYGNHPVFGTITSNHGDDWLHLVLGGLMLILSLGFGEEAGPARPPTAA